MLYSFLSEVSIRNRIIILFEDSKANKVIGWNKFVFQAFYSTFADNFTKEMWANRCTHGSVSCGPRSWCATTMSILTGRTIMQFSRIGNFVMLVRNWMAVEVPSTTSTPHFKFQLNRARHFRPKIGLVSSFSFSSFRKGVKVTIK